MNIRIPKRKIPPLNSAIIRFAALMLLTMSLPFSIILFVTANHLSGMEKKIANQFLSSNLRTVSSAMDQVLTNLERLHVFIFMDTQFLNSMRRLSLYEEREEYSDFININSIRNRINNVAVSNKYISSIFAYSIPAKRIFSSRVNWNADFNYFPSAPWLEVSREEGFSHPWYFTHDIVDNRSILASYREVWAMNQQIGLVSINVDTEEIGKLLYEALPQTAGTVFIIDDRNNIIRRIGSTTAENEDALVDWLAGSFAAQTPENNNGFFDTSFEGTELFVSYYISSYSGFRFVAASELKQIQTGTSIMFRLLMVFFCFRG